MTDPNETTDRQEEQPAPQKKSCGTGRMHENVPEWSDPCCSCEAEPYWIAVADEVENDLEDEKTRPGA